MSEAPKSRKPQDQIDQEVGALIRNLPIGTVILVDSVGFRVVNGWGMKKGQTLLDALLGLQE